MPQDKSHNRGVLIETLIPSSGRISLPFYLVQGVAAFLLFEFCLNFLLVLLSLSRRPGFLFSEFLVFTATSGLIYSYTSWSQQNEKAKKTLSQGLSRLHEQTRSRHHSRARKLERISDGIAESLSAIMFFTRAHLVSAENTQKARDLREIAERIDQVQLLLRELQSPAGNEMDKEAVIEFPESNEYSSSDELELQDTTLLPNEEAWLKPSFSLRKGARKVLILPVMVRFVQAENNLEFQTFTVNICEDGACIILSSNFLAQEEVIDIQIPPEFTAQARLKWIQPVGANSFRLGGIEFLESKFRVSST